ncbi:prim-pol domain-containing protein [Stemphylium lycopersici]|uniref:DNA primase n=1 Tax=Stemphylium lycopersici TaxID=183478 RepID=A0A364MU29_STELY|nr:dna primase small subunit [Stemphylium lycopersici]RAR03633.1 prim-pol domain-containing protein [Stemphylium lycopersici]RAR03984.1 prim-pol domain-containing protein [Stemphylium lycopersici]
MPHSISPESTPAEEMAQPASQVDDVKAEAETQEDVAMDDAPTAAAAETAKVKLEEMFDDADSDPEFASSAPAPASQEDASQPAPLSKSSFSDPDVMRAFYQRLFPFRPLFQWLNHSATPSNDFAHREFAFTLPNDAYLRYQSFPSADLLRKQCVNMLPSRFEIGPMYSTNPRDRKTLRKASAFRPLMKELVFDIDMTDYDDIRTCCTGANICLKCWAFITMAIKTIDVALREDFGFKHILWVYSGRRGAHAWVCDKRAREMDDQKRRSVASYLELLKGGDQGGKKVHARRPLHPHLERSLDILKEHFQTSILADQDPWASDEKAAHLLNLLPDPSLKSALQKKWSSAPSRPSASKWADINALAESGALSKTPKELREAKQDIILEYTYPRLDAEVSKKLNHLLKSPFVIHPGTGRVCVPIDTRTVEEFDPLSVPTVTQLLQEIDDWSGKETDKKMQDWEKTSLKPYVDYFRRFVAALLEEEKPAMKREREEGADAMEF